MDGDYSDAYHRWRDNRCPCCGSAIDDPADIFISRIGYEFHIITIGEGVQLCAFCNYRGHADNKDHVIRLLQSIAEGANRGAYRGTIS
jgi:hypothetical protein